MFKWLASLFVPFPPEPEEDYDSEWRSKTPVTKNAIMLYVDVTRVNDSEIEPYIQKQVDKLKAVFTADVVIGLPASSTYYTLQPYVVTTV